MIAGGRLVREQANYGQTGHVHEERAKHATDNQVKKLFPHNFAP